MADRGRRARPYSSRHIALFDMDNEMRLHQARLRQIQEEPRGPGARRPGSPRKRGGSPARRPAAARPGSSGLAGRRQAPGARPATARPAPESSRPAWDSCTLVRPAPASRRPADEPAAEPPGTSLVHLSPADRRHLESVVRMSSGRNPLGFAPECYAAPLRPMSARVYGSELGFLASQAAYADPDGAGGSPGGRGGGQRGGGSPFGRPYGGG